MDIIPLVWLCSPFEMTTVLKYFSIYFTSTIKFIFGPVIGVSNDLPIVWVIILTVLGMMTTVYLFTFFGKNIRSFASRFRKNPKVFSKRNRRFVKIWKAYGLQGVCMLTPLLLSPPGGALLANLLETNKQKLIMWMWISAVLWGVVLTLVVKYAFWLVADFL